MIYQPHDQQPVKRSWKSVVHPAFKDWVRPLLTVALIVMVINFFFPRYAVQGQSMEPLLHETDRLVASHVEAITGSVKRGEVVVLSSPVDGRLVVKRVIGLPGETIEIKNGQVYIDGTPLVELYVKEAPRYTGTWHLSGSQYFVLGDNRNHSYDSSAYGQVEAALLQGVVEFRWWPPNAVSGFPAPAYPALR